MAPRTKNYEISFVPLRYGLCITAGDRSSRYLTSFVKITIHNLRRSIINQHRVEIKNKNRRSRIYRDRINSTRDTRRPLGSSRASRDLFTNPALRRGSFVADVFSGKDRGEIFRRGSPLPRERRDRTRILIRPRPDDVSGHLRLVPAYPPARSRTLLMNRI